jgi:hypothetical protein
LLSRISIATIAQMVERLICNQSVAGSIPAGGSHSGEVPEWPKGTDCKSVGEAFGGSNPPLTTWLLEVEISASEFLKMISEPIFFCTLSGVWMCGSNSAG